MLASLDTGVRLGIGALAWLGGIACQLQQPALWPASHYLWLGALALLGAVGAWRMRVPLLLPLAVAALAFAATGWRAGERLADALPPALEGQDLLLTGMVASLPRATESGVRFDFEVNAATHDGTPVRVPRHVTLAWYPSDDALLPASRPALRAGQRWLLTVRLRQPHGTLNPHGFDLELWLFERGIRASGTVRDVRGATLRKLADDAGAPVERLRQHIRDAIVLHVSDAHAAGVLAALAVGDQAAIERSDWELFRDTGVAHLMSISGLHVTMFAWLAAGLAGWAWRRSTRLVHVCPAPLAARWAGVLLAAGYALLAGWGVPAQRTLWMLVTLAVLRSAGVRWPAPLVLLAAASVVTLLDPWALLQPGFWLSFVAVGLLMLSDPGAVAPRGAAATLRGALRTQCVASIGLAPLTLIFFQQVSLVGFVANLIAIPLVTLCITPLALLGIVLPVCWTLGAALLDGFAAGLGWLSTWPWGVWTAAAAPGWAMACGLLGGALLVLPLPWRLRALGVPLLLPLVLPAPTPPAPGRFDLLVADVGQGTAVLVRTRSHLLLYDAGPGHAAGTDAGQRVLLPLLRARGESRIDLLVLSHRDSDHVGGAPSLFARAQVQALSSSLEPGHALLAKAPRRHACADGQSWAWDGVRFDMLHPLPGATHVKPNALSCVLRVQGSDGRSVLLTGDIEAAQEAALLARHGDRLRSQVLLVPHHGSRSSSTEAWLRAVAPRTALVQAGYRNRYGHPAVEVVDRYRALGIELLRSDRCGAWAWPADAAPACERERGARYWHHRVMSSG